MKQRVFVFLLYGLLLSNFGNFVHAQSDDCKIEEQNIADLFKIYLSPDQIHINSEGIFVEIEGDVFQVAEISQDENGIYVPCGKFWKVCPYGHPNPPWRWRCKVCKAPL